MNSFEFLGNLNITWNVSLKQKIMIIMLFICSQVPDNTNKPPVLGYIIHHNITTHAVNTTNYTFISFVDVPCGTYNITVSAENVVGVGDSSSVIIGQYQIIFTMLGL